MVLRTVLATDEMLASAIAKKLPGEKLTFDHAEMREKRGVIAKTTLEMLDCSPSVLVIGAEKWDAIKTLLLVAPTTKAPIVWIVPELNEERLRQAEELKIYSVVPVLGAKAVSSVVAVEVRLAAHWLAGRGRRLPFPAVVLNPRAPSFARREKPAPVLELAPQSKASPG